MFRGILSWNRKPHSCQWKTVRPNTFQVSRIYVYPPQFHIFAVMSFVVDTTGNLTPRVNYTLRLPSFLTPPTSEVRPANWHPKPPNQRDNYIFTLIQVGAQLSNPTPTLLAEFFNALCMCVHVYDKVFLKKIFVWGNFIFGWRTFLVRKKCCGGVGVAVLNLKRFRILKRGSVKNSLKFVS